MMEGDKITIYMQCLNWTCGEEAYFDIMLTKGAAVHVSWGDNHCVTVRKNFEEWQRVEHLYPKNSKLSHDKFVIYIESEAPGQIIGFRNWSIDMHTESIDLSGCPDLQYFTAEFMSKLDLTHSSKLKELYIRGCTMSEIDLSANTELEKIECPCSELRKLNLGKCRNLKEVICWCCFNLTHIGISNDSALKCIRMDKDTPIKESSMRFLREAIERNDGEIIYNDNDF